MKTKLKSILVLAILMMCMSSCVYSLFPIYTEDTLVYLPELEGKWILGDDPDHYILFEKAFDVDATIDVGGGQTLSIQGSSTRERNPDNPPTNTSTMTFDISDSSFIVVDGDTIRDKERIKEYYRNEIQNSMKQLGEALSETLEGMGDAFKQMSKTPNPKSFISDRDSYIMTVVDSDQTLKYKVHLAQIGDDIFMDLYATEDEYTDKAFGSMVWFPVHTFMKMELEGDQLTITQFDLDKMNKLFDSNLIRMSHENIDGTILITAKAEEIQKFLEKYARDESVYDEVETYNRIAQ